MAERMAVGAFLAHFGLSCVERTVLSKGVVERRRFRDLFFLLLYAAFWAGMVYIAVIAFKQGHPARLSYGIDSSGNTCGQKNTWNGGSGPDLTEYKNLYYLNPLELLDTNTFLGARSVCVEQCPGAESACGLSSLPCRSDVQYRCPYYCLAQASLYGTLNVTDDWSTSYWGSLLSTNLTAGQCNVALQYLPAKYQSVFFGNVSNPLCGEYLQLTSLYPGRGPCYPVLLETVDYFNRCLPKFSTDLMAQLVSASDTSQKILSSNSTTSVNKYFDSSSQRLQRYIADIQKGFVIIVVAGLVGGLILSLIWMILLRFSAGLMAWFVILAVNLAFAACTLLAFTKAGMLGNFGAVGMYVRDQIPLSEDPSAHDRKIWQICAYVAAGLTGLLIIFTLVIIRRVKVAVACIKVASQAVATMPTLLFWPLVPFVALCCLVVYWVAVAAFLYSAGDIKPAQLTASSSGALSLAVLYDSPANSTASLPIPTVAAFPANITATECSERPDCYFAPSFSRPLQYMFIYHFFGLLWANQFIAGFGCMTIAGAIAQFYYAKGSMEAMPRSPVWSSFKVTLIYHMGTVAIGSFIIALVIFIRIVLEFIQRRTKFLAGAKYTSWVKYLMACISCFLWILEKIVKFINKNAYIMAAIHGNGFCTSATLAVKTIVTNVLRVAAVDTVGDALVFLGKLSVMAGSGVIAMLMSTLTYYTDPVKYPNTFMSSPLLPVILSLIVGYIVASVFFNVYEMAIDTILLAFCEDCESHGGHPKHAPPLLLEAIGQMEATSGDSAKSSKMTRRGSSEAAPLEA